MKDILKDLQKIVFHDLPVERIIISSGPEIEFMLSFFVYEEKTKDYKRSEIRFKDVSKLDLEKLLLKPDSEIEIYGFDCHFTHEFHCSMVLLLGPGEPSCEIKIRCGEIEIKTMPGGLR